MLVTFGSPIVTSGHGRAPPVAIGSCARGAATAEGVQRADDPGGTWRPAGSIGAFPVAAHASQDGSLYLAREDGVVLVSTDGGNEFVERARLG